MEEATFVTLIAIHQDDQEPSYPLQNTDQPQGSVLAAFVIPVWTMHCLGTTEMMSVFPTLSVITDFARSDRWESTG